MTSLSGIKPYFFKSLRINFSAARLFLLVQTRGGGNGGETMNLSN